MLWPVLVADFTTICRHRSDSQGGAGIAAQVDRALTDLCQKSLLMINSTFFGDKVIDEHLSSSFVIQVT